jgi:hypothetical protein
MESHIDELLEKYNVKNNSRVLFYRVNNDRCGIKAPQALHYMYRNFCSSDWERLDTPQESSDDLAILKKGKNEVIASLFRFEDPQQERRGDYLAMIYGDKKRLSELENALDRLLLTKPTCHPVGDFCSKYVLLREAQLKAAGDKNYRMKDWPNRIRDFWDRLEVEGDTHLERELGFGFDDGNFASALCSKAKTDEEKKVLYSAIADLAAFHYSPKTLQKFLEKQIQLTYFERKGDLAKEELQGLSRELFFLLV